MKYFRHGLALLLIAFSFCNRMVAQDFSQLAPMLPNVSSVVKKLCGEVPTFSADGAVIFAGGDLKAPMVMPSQFTFHDSNMRWDVDGSRLEGFPEGTTNTLKVSKLDKIRFVFQAQKKKQYLIFENLRVYLESSIPESVIAEVLQEAKGIKLETKVLGSETLEGYACTKKSVTIPAEAELNQEAIIWTANELKEFPVKIQLKTGNGDVIFQFRNVKFNIPPADTFEAGTNFVQKADSREIVAYAHSLADKPSGTPSK